MTLHIREPAASYELCPFLKGFNLFFCVLCICNDLGVHYVSVVSVVCMLRTLKPLTGKVAGNR